MSRKISVLLIGLGLLMLATPVLAEEVDHTAELAQQLSNPVANLISVPFDYNLDFGIGQRLAEGRQVLGRGDELHCRDI